MRDLSWLGFAVGVVVVVLIASSVFKYLLVPRSTSAVLTRLVARPVYGCFRLATRHVADLSVRERVLATAAPAFLVCLLTAWLGGLCLGYALILLPFTASLAAALRVSGSSMFTLGFAVPAGAAPDAIVFVAAGTGLATVALLIAYLPVMYAAFNRRETLVTMLEALAGAPAWGPELLARQALIDNVGYLPRLYERWTEWSADIAESHTAYRTLVYFRSPDPAMSWLASLIAVLDAAALHLAFNPNSAPAEARPLLRVGYTAVRRLAQSMRMPTAEDPRPSDPIMLSRQEFDDAAAWLQAAGWELERAPDDAWPHFRGWRVNYEASAYALARFLDLPPALWTGPRVGSRPPARAPKRPPHRAPGKEWQPPAVREEPEPAPGPVRGGGGTGVKS